jgi:hypothetical protein
MHEVQERPVLRLACQHCKDHDNESEHGCDDRQGEGGDHGRRGRSGAAEVRVDHLLRRERREDDEHEQEQEERCSSRDPPRGDGRLWCGGPRDPVCASKSVLERPEKDGCKDDSRGGFEVSIETIWLVPRYPVEREERLITEGKEIGRAVRPGVEDEISRRGARPVGPYKDAIACIDNNPSGTFSGFRPGRP